MMMTMTMLTTAMLVTVGARMLLLVRMVIQVMLLMLRAMAMLL